VSDHRVVTLAGHVDHGKSTLLAALTAMAPDRLAEEQRRGLTIELGFFWTELAGTDSSPEPQRVAFVDVPGHERFIGTMVAGSGSSSAAMLVVAADDGLAAQSREHLAILDLLGVPGLAVVLTKSGRIDGDWLDMVEAEIRSELAGTTFSAAPIVSVDSIEGRGLDDLRRVLRDRLELVPRPASVGDGRVWIDRAFPAVGAGTVVTGTLVDGTLDAGVEAHLMPAGGRVRVRRMQSLGEDVLASPPGSRVALNLVGVDHHEVSRGDVLVAGPKPRTTSTIDVFLRTLAGGGVGGRGAWRLHVGTAASTCRVRSLGAEHADGFAARISFPAPLALRVGDRFLLRDVGRGTTVAGGLVVDTSPVQLRGPGFRESHAARIVAAAQANSVAEWIRALLELTGGSRSVEQLHAMLGTDPVPLVAAAEATVVGGMVVADAKLKLWSTEACRIGPGVHPRDAVAALAKNAGAPDAVADFLPDHLVAVGALSRTTLGVALPDEVGVAAEARDARAAIVMEALLETPFAPPPLAECLRAAGLDHRERTALLASGRIVHCGEVSFAAEAIERAIAMLRGLESRIGPFTAAEARDVLDTTRRFALPLLEHLALFRVTHFDGERHRFCA